MSVLDDNRGDVEKMLAGGASAAQVGVRFGVTKNVVIGWMTRRGIENRNRTPVAQGSARRGRRAGMSPYERMVRDTTAILDAFKAATSKPAAIRTMAAKYRLPQHALRGFLKDNGAKGVPDTFYTGGGSPASRKVGSLPEFKPPRRKGKPLLEAGMDECRYPLWSHEQTGGFVCAQPVVKRKRNGRVVSLSWCEECLKVVSRAPEAKSFQRKKVSAYALRRL